METGGSLFANGEIALSMRLKPTGNDESAELQCPDVVPKTPTATPFFPPKVMVRNSFTQRRRMFTPGRVVFLSHRPGNYGFLNGSDSDTARCSTSSFFTAHSNNKFSLSFARREHSTLASLETPTPPSYHLWHQENRVSVWGIMEKDGAEYPAVGIGGGRWPLTDWTTGQIQETSGRVRNLDLPYIAIHTRVNTCFPTSSSILSRPLTYQSYLV
ncbi:hypothetical protein F5X96DRAFT_210110 [Biscogniauxia mediterranea]|nr:hypothetical protein F5X96DRAFT_210110 [Biscogniauxia mediterranea]